MKAYLQRIPWRWLAGGALIGLAVGVVAFYGLPNPETESSQRQQNLANHLGALEEGGEAPDFTLENLQGERVSLSSYRGEVVFLNFWATWCGPCRLEMPALQSRYERYRGDGFVVLGVNAGEGNSEVAAFREELSLSFPLLLDPQEEVQRLYRVRAYPTSVIVDRGGKIAKVHFGVLTEDQLDEYLRELGVGS